MHAFEWSTESVAASSRFEAWQHVLSRSHLEWQLNPLPGAEIAATVRSRQVDELQLVACRSRPCSGRRQRAQIARCSEAYFGLLYVRGGSERVRDAAGERVLRAGDLLFWDSRREQSFTILDTLDKLTLLIPQTAMQAALPRAGDYAGTVIRGPLAGLMKASLETLSGVCDELDAPHAKTASDIALQVLANLLRARDDARADAGPAALSETLLRYIERHLHEDDLNPRRIAQAHGISLRYLHLLFSRHGMSVSRWIKQRRLLRCQTELARQRAGTIAEIAHRWGFGDAAQLSRAFRAEFGCSPRDYRKSSMA